MACPAAPTQTPDSDASPDLGGDVPVDVIDTDDGQGLAIASASATPTSGKAPLDVKFEAQAQGGEAPYKYTWIFGDDSTSGTGTPVTHQYVQGGTFTARLNISDAAGANVTQDFSIEVDTPDAPVIAQLIASPDGGLAPLMVSLDSTVMGSDRVTYAWDLGNGMSSDIRNPMVMYQTAGEYTVVLVVTDSLTGASSVPARKTITVASDEQPSAAASATPQSGIAPFTVSFRGTSVGGNSPYTYSWNFGDGSAPVAAQNPSHDYDVPGVYTAMFTVTDGDGDMSTSQVEITAQSNSVPQVNVSATPEMGLAPLSVNFDPQVQGGDLPLTYAWDLGDGMSSIQPSPAHIYQTPGNYTASVMVTDANGDSATGIVNIVVKADDVPTISAQATPTAGLAPLQTQFNATGMGGNAPLSYAWNFGDGNTTTGEDVAHTYMTAGQYQATVTVTDSDGDVASARVTIDVGSDLVPSANASGSPVTGFAPLNVQLFGNASGGNGTLTYSWNFGDGSPTSNLQSPTHTYSNTGTYTATLVVTDTDGDSTSDTVRIEVLSNAVPDITASASPSTGIAPIAVNFMSSVTSGDAPFTHVWTFGDGSPSSDQESPSHPYTVGGTYIATVTVTDANGDTDSDTVQIDVADDMQPAVVASSDVDTGTSPLAVNFSAAGAGGNGALTYQWFFGDGSAPSAGAQVSHTYMNPGVYQATVVVTDVDGDISDDTLTINVLDQAPDLSVESWRAFASGTDIVYEVVIKNEGVLDASNFVVRFYNDLAQAPDSSTPASESRTLNVVIAPGASETLIINLFNQPIGTYNAWVFVDPENQIPDLDRTNNIEGPVLVDVDGLLINEVYYNAVGSDANKGLFVELYGRPGKDLTGYSLDMVNGANNAVTSFNLPANTTIPSNGYLVIGDGSTPNEDVDAGAWADLQNGPDSLVLRGPFNSQIDALGWGTGAPFFAGENIPAINVGEGYSLGRDDDQTDTDDNSIDFYVWREPTPGFVNITTMINFADTCADAYLFSNGQSGKFLIKGNLAATTNDYSTLDTAAPNCSLTTSTPAGADQILSFVVPSGRVADVTLDIGNPINFDVNGDNIDIDAVLTMTPCSDLTAGIIGCNFIFDDTYTTLGPGTYYVVVLHDTSTPSNFISAAYTYNITLDIQ